MNVRVTRPKQPKRSVLHAGVVRVVSRGGIVALVYANGESDCYDYAHFGGLELELDRDGGGAILE